MLRVASLILIYAAFPFVVCGQIDEARLLDKFERITCSDFRGRIDSFMAEIASTPTAVGYVALSTKGKYLDVFRRRKMIDEQLSLRDFPKERVVFVRRDELAPLEVEMWIVTKGAILDFEYQSSWSYELPRAEKAFVLVTGGFDESECPPARDAEFVTRFLKANPESRSNIVIRCRGHNCFRETRTRFEKELVSQGGVSRRRLKFFYVPIDSDYYAFEFWILN